MVVLTPFNMTISRPLCWWAPVLALSLSASLWSAPTGLPPLPAPQGVPAPGPVSDGPYQPTTLVPDGVVVPIYPPDSPALDQTRIREAETYGSYNPPHLGYIVNIHNPSIEYHAAHWALDTGTAVILVPGGGHEKLNAVGEGADIVPYLTRRGIHTLILRNRLRSDGYDPSVDGRHDVQQAIKVVRAYAEEWGIRPNRIGVVGFSAGGQLVGDAVLFYPEFDAANDVAGNPLAKISSRPDFAGMVYTGPTPFSGGGTAAIPRDAPPVFLTGPGWGDAAHALDAAEFYTALLKDGVPNLELHLYARGVHPGDSGHEGQPPATAGINDRLGVGFGSWEERFMDWLDDLGFMDRSGAETRAAKDVAAQLERATR